MRTNSDNPGGSSDSSAFSFGGHLEKKNSITSIESGVRTPSIHSSIEDEGPVVVPHMGLLSSCNMVSDIFDVYTYFFLGGFSPHGLNFFFFDFF